MPAGRHYRCPEMGSHGSGGLHTLQYDIAEQQGYPVASIHQKNYDLIIEKI